MKKMNQVLLCLAIVVLLSGCDILLSLYATVNFDSGEGTKIHSSLARIGDLLDKPSNPVRNDYIFIGWYYGDNKWDFNKDVVEKDITLTARWKPNIPANYDTNAAWQLLRGTWTNGVYTVIFQDVQYGVNWYKEVSWSGYGASGREMFGGPEYDEPGSIMYASLISRITSVTFCKMNIIFRSDGTTMELFPRYYSCNFLTPGEWTKLS